MNLLYQLFIWVLYAGENVAELPLTMKTVRELQQGLRVSNQYIQSCLDGLSKDSIYRGVQALSDSHSDDAVVGYFCGGLTMDYVKNHYDKWTVSTP